MRAILFASSLTLLFPTVALSQDSTYSFFLFEPNYAGLGEPTTVGAPPLYEQQDEVLAEAQLAPHLRLRSGFAAQYVRDGEGRGLNVYLTPQMRLRALKVNSAPIRSLSFMPRFTFQYLWADRVWQGNALAGGRKVTALSGVIGHHSNGGEGCGFADEVPMPHPKTGRETCTSTAPELETRERQFRTEGGDFSTNYIELGVFRRYGSIEDTEYNGLGWNWAVDLGLTLQWNHSGDIPLPGGAKGDFAKLYGRWRPRIDGGLTWRFSDKATARSWVRVENTRGEVPRYNGASGTRWELRAVVQPSARVGILQALDWLAVGVQHVRGQDYYNAQFVRDIRLWQLIVAVDDWSPWLS